VAFPDAASALAGYVRAMTQRTPALLGAATLAAVATLIVGVTTAQAALGLLTKYAPLQTGATPTPEQVVGANDVAVSGGLAFVADGGRGRIAVYNTTTGKYIRQIGSKGAGQGQLQLPVGIALVSDAGLKQTLVVVSDSAGAKIVVYRASDGGFVREFGVRGSKDGQLDQPSSITSDGRGVIWVSDFGNDRIQAFTTAGAFRAKLADPDGAYGRGHVVDLALDSGGTLWATYTTAGPAGILQINGADLRLLLKTPLKQGYGIGQIAETIGGIAVSRDLATRARTLYVVDAESYRILRFGVGPNLGDAPAAIDSWPAKGDEKFSNKPARARLAAGVFHVLGVVPAYAVSTWGTKTGKATATPGTPATATFAGAWATNFGTLTVTVNGTAAAGTYTHDSGKVTATASGRLLTGTWSESPTYAGPKDAGTFTLTLSADGKSFTGSWKYADGSTSANQPYWNGKR